MPGIPFTVHIPVAFNDRPPAGDETAWFTYKEASRYDEDVVAINLPRARTVGRMVIEGLAEWTSHLAAPPA